MQPRDQLTTKEIQVTTLVWEGVTNREIAKIVGTTEQVIKNYLRTAFDKLCMEPTRVGAVRGEPWRGRLGRPADRSDGGGDGFIG